MNNGKRYKALAEHFKVDKGKYATTDAWFKAVKAAAGMPNDAIEVIYDKVILKKSAPAPIIEAKATEVKAEDKKVEETKIITPTSGPISSSHQVDVKAPVFNINVPAPTINTSYGAGNSSLADTFARIGQHGFTFFSGSLTGAGLLFVTLIRMGVLKIGGAI